MKTCKDCKEQKDISMFYKSRSMLDGHLNSCKECIKAGVRKNRAENIEYYREYDRVRGGRQTREYLSIYRAKFKRKYRAHNMVNNAIRDGKLFSEPCETCGDGKAHAHHDDYARPLNVRWLCAAHHKEWHKENGEGKNAV